MTTAKATRANVHALGLIDRFSTGLDVGRIAFEITEARSNDREWGVKQAPTYTRLVACVPSELLLTSLLLTLNTPKGAISILNRMSVNGCIHLHLLE